MITQVLQLACLSITYWYQTNLRLNDLNLFLNKHFIFFHDSVAWLGTAGESFDVSSLERSRWPTDIFGVFVGMAARWGTPQGLFTSKEPLPTAEVSTRVFGQGNQIFYSVTQDSQKHNSRSCQTFLRLRPRTLRASILLVSIGYSEQQTQTRFNVQEDYTRIWVWGRNVGVGEFWRTDYRNMLCS